MAYLSPEESFETLKKRTTDVIGSYFPLQGGNNHLVAKKVWVEDDKHIDDIEGQLDAKLKGRTWAVPVKAELELRDAQTGKVKETKVVTVAQLPKITRRYTHIVDGNEWQVSSQFRLKSGVYTRVKDNGELSSQWNLARGHGFTMDFDPESRQMKLGYGSSNVPLYPILKTMGVSDSDIEKRWGKEILASNSSKDHDQAIRQMYKAMTGKTGASVEESRKYILDEFAKNELRPDSTQFTLGKPFTKVDGTSLLEGSHKLLKVSRQEEEPDDRDALHFKDLHSTEDLLHEALNKDYKKDIVRKLGNSINRKESISEIVSPDVFNQPIHRFFTSSGLAERPDHRNPIGFIIGARKTTTLGKHGIDSERKITLDAQSINPSHLGFLDPIHTPESGRIGAVLQLSSIAQKVGHDLKIPVYEAQTGKKVFIDAATALKSNLAFADQYTVKDGKPIPNGDKVKVSDPRGDFAMVTPKEVHYVLPSSKGLFDPGTNLIPFLQSNQGNRAMMAAKQLEQAVPLIHRETPLVLVKGEGDLTYEQAVGKLASHVTRVSGVVTAVDKNAVHVKSGKEIHKVPTYNDFPLNDNKSMISSTPIVKVGDTVKAGQVVADSSFTRNGVLSMGTNLRAAYIPWRGLNFEDGIVISESAAKKLTSEHLHRHSTRIESNTILDKDRFLAEYAGKVTKEQSDKLDEHGVIKPGMRVMPGDILIGEIRKEELTPEQKQVSLFSRQAARPYRADPTTWDMGYPGEVSRVVKHGKNVTVYIKTLNPAEVGDKLVARHANKGVIAAILPDHEMPHTKEGKSADILLNPAGIPTRTNVGQVLETAASKIAEKTGKPYIANNFDPNNKDYTRNLLEELKSHGLSDTEEMIDPSTGKSFGQVLFGPQHFLKLHHAADKKLLYRSRDTYTANLTPSGGGKHSGQSMDASGLYALLAHGARENVREFQTSKSEMGDEFWNKLQAGEPVPPPKIPFVYKKFEGYLKGAGIDVHKEGSNLVLGPLTDKGVLAISNGELKNPGLILKAKGAVPETGGLFDPVVTGTTWPKGKLGDKWSHITLAERMPNPVFEKPIRVLTGLSEKDFGEVLGGRKQLDGKTGAPAISSYLKGINVPTEIKTIEDKIAGLRGANLDKANQKLKFLRALKTADIHPHDAYTMQYVPVLPPNMRPISVQGNGDLTEADLNGLYARAVAAPNMQLRMLKDDKAIPVDEHHPVVEALYDGLKALTMTGMTYKNRYRSGIIEQISGAQKGGPKCFDGETEVLTRHGWVSLSGYDGIEPLGTVNLETDFFEWQRPVDFTKQAYSGPMHRLLGDLIDLLVTPNHRHVLSRCIKREKGGKRLREWTPFSLVPSVDLLGPMNRGRLMVSANNWEGHVGTYSFLDKQVDLSAFASFVGWWVAEGWLGKSNSVYISQSSPEGIECIDDMFRRLQLPHTRAEYNKKQATTGKITYWCIISPELTSWLKENISVGCENKKLSNEVLDWPGYMLRELLDSYLRGDGDNEYRKSLKFEGKKTHQRRDMLGTRFSSSSLLLIENLQHLAVKIGLRVSAPRREVKTPKYAKPHHLPVYRASVLGYRDVSFGEHLRVKVESFTGIVYGPTVKNGTVVVRRNGVVCVSGNSGFFQDKVIGRRQDMSMRGNIVPDPSIHLDEVALPRKAAAEMYKPFVVARLSRMGFSPLEAQKAGKSGDPVYMKALEAEIEERPVLLKRDPVLHKYGVQAFKPRLVEGSSIKVHPLIVDGFNADFDGDQMSAFVPVSQKAVQEAHKMFPSNMLFSPATGEIMYKPKQEAMLGLYKLTEMGKKKNMVFNTAAEAARAVKDGKIGINDVVKVKNVSALPNEKLAADSHVETTVGRLLVYSALPPAARKESFLTDPSEVLDKKGIKRVFDDLGKNHQPHFSETADKLKDLGNSHVTGMSVGLSDFVAETKDRDEVLKRVSPHAEALYRDKSLTKDMRDKKLVALYEEADKEIQARVRPKFDASDNRMYQWVKSGARGDWSQFRQMNVAPMLVVDSKNRTVPIPITKSYGEGLDIGSYWTAMHGARMGTIGRVQGTELPGAMFKEMVNTTINQLVNSDDCGTAKGVVFSSDDKHALDRYTVKDIDLGVKGGVEKGVIPAGTLVTPRVMDRLKNNKIKEVLVRSPMKCQHADGVCSKCMGLNENGKQFEKGTNVGILAAQTLGEPLTQLSMNAFHTGGVSGAAGSGAVDKITRFKNLLQLPEVLRDSATLSEEEGVVHRIDKDPAGGWNVHVNNKVHFVPGRLGVVVKIGQEVKKGDSLSSGFKNPREMLPLTGLSAVQRYLSDELSDIYGNISPLQRRNVEVVVRSLTNLSEVHDPGSHPDFVRGDYAPTSALIAHNANLKPGEKPIKHVPILKGTNIMPIEMQTDWLARMQTTRLKDTLLEGVAKGWKSNIHGTTPIPGMAVGAHFGLGTEEAPWLY